MNEPPLTAGTARRPNHAVLQLAVPREWVMIGRGNWLPWPYPSHADYHFTNSLKLQRHLTKKILLLQVSASLIEIRIDDKNSKWFVSHESHQYRIEVEPNVAVWIHGYISESIKAFEVWQVYSLIIELNGSLTRYEKNASCTCTGNAGNFFTATAC